MKIKKGFTLIELLVVVLIIGILASIAVPQYQKAVEKSRITQWANYVGSAHMAMEAWRLANNMPEKNVRFTGTATSSEIQGHLDIDLTCTKIEGIYCYTKLGRFNLGCNASVDQCWLDFTFTKSDGSIDTNKVVWTSRYFDGQYNNKPTLSLAPTDINTRKLICSWWADHYGKEQMYERALTSCAEVGI